MSTMLSPNFLYLSVAETAEALGVTGARVRQLLIGKRLAGQKVGQRAWIVPAGEVERYRDSGALRRRHNGSNHKQ